MQRPIEFPIGTAIADLDTPSLLVDLTELRANIEQFATSADRPWRAEAWRHKTPAIALLQLAADGCCGISVRSISEAETFAAAGCDDILLTRPIVQRSTRARAEELADRITLRTTPSDTEASEDGISLAGTAITVSARVASCPEPGRAITDCGQKAIGNDIGRPRVLGHDDLRAIAGSAEHGMLLAGKDQPDDLPFEIGDWCRLVPGDASTTFNLHDFACAIRNGRLAAVWPISARGAYT